ncbi:MAG: YtxH domain-containing protein [Elusimicrobiota bacterium]|nr:YtxH domain-containing protein [Elusimicrobiota bacterium]
MADNGGDMFSSFLLGGIIGAALGVLFAPASGKKTRRQVNEWVEDTKETSVEKLEDVEDVVKKGKEKILKHIN